MKPTVEAPRKKMISAILNVIRDLIIVLFFVFLITYIGTSQTSFNGKPKTCHRKKTPSTMEPSTEPTKFDPTPDYDYYENQEYKEDLNKIEELISDKLPRNALEKHLKPVSYIVTPKTDDDVNDKEQEDIVEIKTKRYDPAEISELRQIFLNAQQRNHKSDQQNLITEPDTYDPDELSRNTHSEEVTPPMTDLEYLDDEDIPNISEEPPKENWFAQKLRSLIKSLG